RRHTRSKRDWSSDVCSSDLGDVIEDEGKRIMVTSKIKAVDGLAGNQEQNADEEQQGEFQPEEDQEKWNPRKSGLHFAEGGPWRTDRKSIRLNSSHVSISYAV